MPVLTAASVATIPRGVATTGTKIIGGINLKKR